MSIFDDIKEKADANEDGKITKDDLEALKGGNHDEVLDQLKSKADANSDGKLDLADLQDLGGNLGNTLTSLKNKLFK